MSRDILIDSIDADPDQPRRHFDADQLAELAESIAANGLIVPILLRPVGERHVIVHGERRFRACKSLGWSTIPADVRELDVETARWLALVENIQRADLTPIEEAQAYATALATGLTQKQLAERIGKKQPDIAQKLRLLKMAPEVQEAVAAGTLTEGTARQLLRLDATKENWRQVVDRCVSEDWSVRRAKNYVDFQLLVIYPQWWEVEGTFADLDKFANKLEEECAAGYATVHELQCTQRARGRHMGLAAQITAAGKVDLAISVLAGLTLSELNEWGKFTSMCQGYDIPILDAVKARWVLDTVDDPRRELYCDIDFDGNRGQVLTGIVKRACEWFDTNKQYILST